MSNMLRNSDDRPSSPFAQLAEAGLFAPRCAVCRQTVEPRAIPYARAVDWYATGWTSPKSVAVLVHAATGEILARHQGRLHGAQRVRRPA